MKGKYMLAAGGAALVIAGCICSPLLASKIQNERLLNNVVIKEGVKEEKNALSFPEKIALYAKGSTVTWQNEKHNIPIQETDRISVEGIEWICSAAERELQTLKELGILPKKYQIELPRGEKWYEIETFTDKQANWVTVYQIAVSGTDYGYISLSIEKESGKIMELYVELNELEGEGMYASENTAGDDTDAVQDSRIAEPNNSMELAFEAMKEGWGKYIGMSPLEEEKDISGEVKEIELDGKGVICAYGTDPQISYFLNRGEKTIEISTVCKDDTSMR